MIRSHFGLQRNPFDHDAISMLPHQNEVFDITRTNGHHSTTNHQRCFLCHVP